MPPTDIQPNDLPLETQHEIAEASLVHWGLAGAALALISQSENTVYRVDAPDGGRYALRLHRPGYHTLAELESELLWTTALNEAGIGAPVGIRTLAGPGYADVPAPDGSASRIVGLVEWLEGTLLSAALQEARGLADITAHFRQVGRAAAAMHNQAHGWTPPAPFTRHAFDVDGYTGPSPVWGKFWECPLATAEQQATLEHARTQIARILTEYGQAQGTYSLIHADMHVHNYMLDPSGKLQLFDFDDAGYGWHHYDLATALFGLEAFAWYPAAQAAILDGYREVRPFPPEAAQLLPLFLLIRKLVLIGWQYDRPELGRREGLEAWIADACQSITEFAWP